MHSALQIDSYTVLLFGLFIKLVLGGLFVVFWLRSRSSIWFAWWSAALAFGCATTIFFMLRASAENFLTIGIGNAMLIAALACCWQGSRAFEKRAPLWLPTVAIPALWLAAACVPAFLENIEFRIVMSSSLVALLAALCGWEFWRGRDEHLASRWPVVVVFISLSLFFALRIFAIHLLPFPFGMLPMQPGWLGAFNLILFAHTLLLVVLMVALTKERLELDQRTKAQTDPLTGAENRRAFTTRGARLIARHRHDRAPLSLLFVDLDNFKALNDRLGHAGGDEVLMAFVDLVSIGMRPTDFLFRFGGEEFCCLLPHTGVDEAHGVAERIRHLVEVATIRVAGGQARVTVSVGVSSTEGCGYDLDTLMRRADAAVYAAKKAGRNCVVSAGSEPDEAEPAERSVA